MNYKESNKILKEIKSAQKILVNCHRGPDSDSVGSALAMTKLLRNMGKEVLTVCPSEIPKQLTFLEGASEIKRIDFASFDFSKYDLFLVLDSSEYSIVSGSDKLQEPNSIKLIVIDHHFTNKKFGKINLVDSDATSTGELLYNLFSDWKANFDSEISEGILTGIIGDTGCFQYQNVGEKTLRISADLIKNGANKDKIIHNLYRSVGYAEIKAWGKIINNMEIDLEHRFVWSKFSVLDFANLINTNTVKQDAANLFLPIVEDTDFGFVIEEREDDVVSVSFRSRSDFDVSPIAREIGGGGHKASAAARIVGLTFDKAVEKVLDAARKYAKKV